MMKSKRLSRRMIIPSDDDWYQTAVKTHRTEKDRWDLWKPSEEWLPRVHAGVWSPEVAVRLIRSLRVLADMLGVPPQTEFELAACANIGTAAAGFHDVPHFLRPYILFDAGVGRLVDSAHICDVYCGLAIHEAAHILYTRHYYRIASTVGPFKQRLMNILEDDRIESKLKSHFGVAAGYLHILKRELLEKSSIHANLDAPEQHAPLNSIATFILTFVRAPWMISGNSAHWVAPNDNQPALLRLRDILRSPSATENDVEEQANALLDWLNKLGWQTKELDAAATPGMHDDGEKSVASGDQQRNQKRRGGNQSVGSAKKTAAHERTKDELKDSVLEKRFLFGEVKDGFDEQFRLARPSHQN